MAGFLLVLLILLLVLLPRIGGAAVGAVLESLFGKAGNAFAERRHNHPVFTTRLAMPDVLDATTEAASTVGASVQFAGTGDASAVVSFAGGATIGVAVTPVYEDALKVRLAPYGTPLDDSLTRLRGSMLAAL